MCTGPTTTPTRDQRDRLVQGADGASSTPGFFYSFFATGDQLVLGMDAEQMTLYAGAPDEQPREWLQEPGGSVAAANSCGRVVALGNAGGTPAGTTVGFFAETLEPAAPKVELGSESQSVLAAAGAQFGMLWYARIGAPGGGGSGSGMLNFATLSWR